MKKILCIVISLILIMSSFVVYADTDTLFNATGRDVTSAKIHTEFALNLNKPFDFITELMNDEDYYDMPIDVKMLAESACSVTETIDLSYAISEDGKKMKYAAISEMDLPLKFNESFRTDIWTKVGVWVEMDITDIENPVLKIIYKMPLSTKYFVLDYADMVEIDDFSEEEFIQGMQEFNTEELVKENEVFFKNLVLENVNIRETSVNELYEITADDTGFKNIIKGTANKLFDIISDSLNLYDEIDSTEFRYQFEQYLAVIDELQIIGNDGIKLNVTLKNGKISISDFSMHLSFNLHDAITAFGGDLNNYNREKWEIDCTVSSKSEYENVNENIEIAFPELTDENSQRIINPESTNYYEPEYNTIYIYQSGEFEIDENGNAMVKLKDAMTGCRIAKKYYKTEAGKITITPGEGQYDFVTAEMEVGSDIIVVDGAEIALCAKVSEQDDGTILIPADAVTAMTGYTLYTISQNFDEDYYMGSRAEFKKENPEYVAEEYEYVSYWINIRCDGMPVAINNELYLPLNPAMGELIIPAENINVTNGEITVITDGTIPEFSELKMSVNSNEIYVNSEKIILNNSVVEKDGTVYIPVQVLEAVNCTVTKIECYVGDTPGYVVYGTRDIIKEQQKAEYVPYIPEYNTLWVEDEGKIVVNNDEYYLPLWPLMGELMVRAEDISETENSVTVKSEDPATGFKTLVIEGASVTMDDKQQVMTKPMLKMDGKSYLPAEFVTDILGGEIIHMNAFYNGEQKSYNFRIKVPNPLYTESE